MSKVNEGTEPAMFTFDDVHFGMSTNGNKSLTEVLFARPAGLTNGAWYSRCQNIARLLNDMLKNARATK